MVFTALSLLAIVFFGWLFDDFSRSTLSLLFAVVFLLVWEHFLGKGWNHFLVLSISSMLPYVVWMILDWTSPLEDRHTITTLMTILPFAVAVTIGLDFLFRHTNNRDLSRMPSHMRPRSLRRLAARR